MWEVIIMLFYFSLDCLYCQASDLLIVPKKDHLLLAAGDELRLDCVHVYQGDVADVATFSKDGAVIPMSNDKGFSIFVEIRPDPDTTTRTTTLKKVNTKVTDSGIYKCVVQDKSIKITVNIIQVVPVDAVLPTETGGALELRCNTSGMTADSNDVRWVWTFKNKTLRNDEKYNIINNKNSGILQIKSPDRTNMGKYLCSLTQKNDVKIETPRSVFLRASPIINSLTIETHSTNLALQCTASGSPIPNVFWTKDGAKVNETSYSIVNTDQNIMKSSVVLKNDEEDDGVYSCIAYNDVEPFNATAQKVIGREVRSSFLSGSGPVHKQTSSIPFISTLFVIFIAFVLYC